MRKLFPLVLIFLAACGNKTDNKNEPGKYVVGMDGLDEIKIGMKQAELEKLLNQKLVLKNAEANAEIWVDTARVKYKDMDMVLYFQREYQDENDFYMYLTGVETGNSSCKTKTGIGIGDSKEKIISAYPDNFITMGPGYENDTSNVASKTKYFIRVKNDDWNRELVFHLDDKKVSSVEAGMVFDEGD
jgi:hypothetical protein